MGFVAWDILLILSLICFPVKCLNLETCGTISNQCNPSNYHIVITNTDANSDLFQNILEQCNAHHDCHVDNPKKECVKIDYHCRMNFPIMEIKKSSDSDHRAVAPMLGFMSEGYLQKRYQNAENINCNLTLDTYEKHKQIHWMIYELASLADTSDVCLDVDESQMPPFCSGSRKLDRAYGPFKTRREYQFSLRPSKIASSVPKIRFWIDIKVSPDDKASYHLKCRSDPEITFTVKPDTVTTEQMTATKSPGNLQSYNGSSSTIIISMSVMGTFVLITMVAITLLTFCWCKQNDSKCLEKGPKDTAEVAGLDVEEYPYTYIDLPSDDARVELDRLEKQNTPKITPEMRRALLLPGLEGTLRESTLQSLKLGNDDPVCSEVQRSIQDLEVPPALPPIRLTPASPRLGCKFNTIGSIPRQKHESKASESSTTKECPIYLEMSGFEDKTGLNAEIKIHEGHIQGNENRYSSMTHKHRESALSAMELTNCYDNGKAHDSKTSERPKSQGHPDYLELFGDDGYLAPVNANNQKPAEHDQFYENKENSETANDYISLLDTEKPNDGIMSKNPYTPLTNAECNDGENGIKMDQDLLTYSTKKGKDIYVSDAMQSSQDQEENNHPLSLTIKADTGPGTLPNELFATEAVHNEAIDLSDEDYSQLISQAEMENNEHEGKTDDDNNANNQ